MAEGRFPKKFPEQWQEPPGLEYEMKPQPEVIRPGYKGSDKLLNKVALITGGDSGIGRAVAVHFAREGADVAINYLPEEELDAQKTKKMIESEGRQCLLLAGNIQDRKFCITAIQQTVKKFSKLNILVNNAAEQHSGL
jgi:NAD(P)-dependent dehydrogenase (short-subunit alcohol dehydrogenase family)